MYINHINAHMYIKSYIHTYIRTYIHHIHIYTHTHIQANSNGELDLHVRDTYIENLENTLIRGGVLCRDTYIYIGTYRSISLDVGKYQYTRLIGRYVKRDLV